MNPHDVFCPHADCPGRGRVAEGTIGIHACTPPRCRCTVCGTTGRTIQTAYIERLNGTFRARLASLTRRTRGVGRTVARLEAADAL